MSTPQNPRNDDVGSPLDALTRRVETLTNSLMGERRQVERKRTTFLVVGATLMALSTIGFFTLTSMTFQLDANALARIGMFKVESQIPQGRERAFRYLEAKAPEFTSYAIGALVGCVPSVRPYILAEMDTQFALLVTDYETRLNTLLEDSFATSKAQLDTSYPGLSDAEKVDTLVTLAAGKFNENVLNLYHELYPSYASQIKSVENYILGLKDKSDNQLTVREKAEKEIIQTLLALIAREQQTQGTTK